MLLVMDVGNTNIKTGLFFEGKLRSSWRLATDQSPRRPNNGWGWRPFSMTLPYPPQPWRG